MTLVDRVVEHVEAINRGGLRITGPIAEFIAPMPAFTPDAIQGQWDTIILATKAQHTEEATRSLAAHLTADGFVLSAQNGLNELVISQIVGRERTVGAFVNFGADYLEPGVIHYGGRGAVVLGELDGRITPRVEALRQTLLDFDDRAVVTSNIWGYLWGKEAYGAMLFATALTNESIADCLALPAYRELFIALAREVLAVAVAQGRHAGGLQRLRSRRPICPEPTRPRRCARWTSWWRSTAAPRRRIAASGAIWPCANAAPRWTRRSASWRSWARRSASPRRSSPGWSR